MEETVIKTENRQDAADLTLELIEHVPESHQNGNILIRNKDLTVCAWEEGYVLWFPALKNIYEIWMKADGSFACIYYRLPMTEEEQDSLFLAIRPVFLFLAQKKACLRCIPHLFFIWKKHGCFPVRREWENRLIRHFGKNCLTRRF